MSQVKMDTDYSDMLDLADILNTDPQSYISSTQEEAITSSINNSFENPLFDNATITSVENIQSEIELEEFSNFLVQNRNAYTDETINLSNLDNSIFTSSSLYTHMNNHISFTDPIPTNIVSSNETSIMNSVINSPLPSSIIDEQLLTEIDSLISKNNNNNNNNNGDADDGNSSTIVPLSKVSKEPQFQTQTPLVKLSKKLSVKRLPTNISQSPTTKRLAKSPAKKKGMAQSAAVVATSTPSMKGLAELQRHESARAAARAVGSNNNSNINNNNINNSNNNHNSNNNNNYNNNNNNNNNIIISNTTTNNTVTCNKPIHYTHSNDQFKKSVNVQSTGRLMNSKANPNVSQNKVISSKKVSKQYSQSQYQYESQNLHIKKKYQPQQTQTQSQAFQHKNKQKQKQLQLQLKSQSQQQQHQQQPEMLINFAINPESPDLTSEIKLLDSPLRISKLRSAKVKPSSCSIYSSATSNSVRTNISAGSNTSKNSTSSKSSGTFDMYAQLPGSSDTLETIVSLSTNDSNQNMDKEIQFVNNTKNQYMNSKYNSPPTFSSNSIQLNTPPISHAFPQQQIINFSPQVPVRANSTISTHSELSTSSFNALTYASTPSPVSGNNKNSTIFTPPSLLLSTNRRSSFVSTPNLEFVNVNNNNITGSPLTPVTKTALKFEQLTTNSSPNLNTGRFSSGAIKYNHEINGIEEESAVPKLSVWKTVPPPQTSLSLSSSSSSSSNLDIQNHLKEFRIVNTNIHSSKLSDEVEAEKFMKTMSFTNTSNHNLQELKKNNIEIQNSIIKFEEELFNFDKADENKEFEKDNNNKNKNLMMNSNKIPMLIQTASNSIKNKTLVNSKNKNRNSINSIYSNTSTNSTISNSSTHDDRDGKTSMDMKQSQDFGENLHSSKRKTSLINNTSTSTTTSNNNHNNSKNSSPQKQNYNKSSKDAAFRNLITTFNKKEPESYKPKVYSNMMQGLVEFQVKMGAGGTTNIVKNNKNNNNNKVKN